MTQRRPTPSERRDRDEQDRLVAAIFATPPRAYVWGTVGNSSYVIEVPQVPASEARE